MAAGRRLQTEILVSLAVVMLTATLVFALLQLRMHQSSGRQLQQLATRALIGDLQSGAALDAVIPGLDWWIVDAEGVVSRHEGSGGDPPPAARALALRARAEGRSLLESGAPWQPTRIATPLGDSGRSVVAEIPAVTSLRWVLVVLSIDVLVFTLCGLYLLKRQVVTPLAHLAQAAHALAGGAVPARIPEEGSREVAELARIFNEMTESLDRRTREREQAIEELQRSNRQLREAHEGLDRASRLAAVGRLAAGVAHEVGNPMGALLAFLDLARRDPGLSETTRGHLLRAGEQGQRVRGILRQLLDFSRPPTPGLETIDLCELCRRTAELVTAQQRYRGIEIAVECEVADARVCGDRNTLIQIVLNLLINAADALRDGSSSERWIRVTIREASTAERPALDCIVADNGPGIPSADRERIFDPFFTTKDPGQGTGLGLPNALRFAEQLGGDLDLVSQESGQGAVFRLRLPVASGTAAGTAVSSAVTSSSKS